MNKVTIVERSESRLLLNIASVNRWLVRIIYMAWASLFLFSTILILFFGEGGGFLFRAGGALFFVFCFFSTACPVYWLYRGYEVFEIDKTRDFFQFYRQGCFKFHRKQGPIATLSNFGVNIRSTEIVQEGSPAETALGYDKGKLQFYAGRKKVEFGTALNDEEAQEVIAVVSRFLEGNG